MPPYFPSLLGPAPLVCAMPDKGPLELPGLQVQVEKVVHHRSLDFPPETPHAFVYFLRIANLSDRAVTLTGRKWILRADDGGTEIVEGDGIVGQTPHLAPGEIFRYNSYHLAGAPLSASGAFHGKDDKGAAVFARIPEFRMEPPAA